jgi:hypothetical protein
MAPVLKTQSGVVMSIWAQRIFPHPDIEACDSAQGRFAELFAAIGSPSNMLLLSVETDQGTKLVAELPHPVLLHALNGFERVDQRSVPEMAELIVGWEDRFERQFRSQPLPMG